MTNETILLELAAIGAPGVGAQWVAWRFGIPAIAPLLFNGLLRGPLSGLVEPRADFGPVVQPLVSAAETQDVPPRDSALCIG